METTEFPVGRLLNGDSYKTQTRMKNISSAMNWIQKQMESLRESDKQLLSLFNKLEADMVDLKTLCSDGCTRGRMGSVSSIGMITAENSASSLRYLDNYQQQSRILEESGNEYHLERSSSNDSLENFADLLGEDDDVPPRTSLKSQGSNISSDFNSNFSLHDHDTISGGASDMRGLDDALSMTSQSSGNSSTRLNPANSSPRLSHSKSNKNRSHYSSNDSGALVDNEIANVTTVGHENTRTSAGFENTLTPATTEADKRLSGLAGEIFALLNMK